MITQTMTLTRKELIEILERKYNVKFGWTCLSSTGFRGGLKNDNRRGN